jgi:hypothetical protein
VYGSRVLSIFTAARVGDIETRMKKLAPQVIFFAALILRVVLGSQLLGILATQANPFGANEKAHIAAHIAQGEGFSSPYEGTPVLPSAQQPPLYPFVLAAIFRLFGVYSQTSAVVVVGINALLGAIIAVLILWVGRLCFSEGAGLLAGWIWALWTTIAATDLLQGTYTLSALVVVGWLLALPWALKPSAIRALLLGLGLGLSALLNPTLLLLLPASFGFLRGKWKHVLVTIAGTLVMVTPWVVRNYFAIGHFVPVRDNFGLELFLGNHPGMDPKSNPCTSPLCEGTSDYRNSDYPARDPKLFSELGEVGFMQRKQQQAIEYIRAYPGQFARRSLKRLLAFWLVPSPLFSGMLAVLAWVGAVRSRSPLRGFLLIMLGIFPGVYYVTQVSWVASYRHPLEPLLLLSATGLISSLIVSVRQRRWKQAGAAPAQYSRN